MENQLTYQPENKGQTLEQMEWDYVWWEQTSNTDAKRILYIGDSISFATHGAATQLSENTYLFDNFASSKAVDNPYFSESIALFAKQEGHREAVLFNNGLHGWHLDDAQYAREYQKIVEALIAYFPKTPLILVLSTGVLDEEQHRRVIKRNEIVQRIAAEKGLPVLDFYTVSEKVREHHAPDGVHFTGEGTLALAQTAVDYLNCLFNNAKK